MKKYDIAVFIGRFQPFHNGHKNVIETALKKADKVIVLCGSSNSIPNSRNPFTFYDRYWMIEGAFPAEIAERKLVIEPINDYPYDDTEWVNQIYDVVNGYLPRGNGKDRVALIGHNKDDSSYYLKKFPLWNSIDVKGVNLDGSLIDATYIREVIFNDKSRMDYFLKPTKETAVEIVNKVKKLIPSSTYDFLIQYIQSDQYATMYEEVKHDIQYVKQWGPGPHVTVDAVCVQANHVLLIKRKHTPGKGQWALPGGFINPSERLEDACIRELKEETCIDVPGAILKNRIKHEDHFANPHRSTRARIITFAFLIDLNSEIERKVLQGIKAPIGFTKVKGADDAEDAKWVNIEELKPEMLFEDHYHIIMKMLKFME